MKKRNKELREWEEEHLNTSLKKTAFEQGYEVGFWRGQHITKPIKKRWWEFWI